MSKPPRHKGTKVCWKCSTPVPKNWIEAGFGRTTTHVDGKLKSVSFTCPDCAAKAVSKLAGGKTWQSTTVLPDSDTTVMVFHPEWNEPIWVGYHDGEEWLWVNDALCEPQPTHWMNFPEPPEAA